MLTVCVCLVCPHSSIPVFPPPHPCLVASLTSWPRSKVSTSWKQTGAAGKRLTGVRWSTVCELRCSLKGYVWCSHRTDEPPSQQPALSSSQDEGEMWILDLSWHLETWCCSIYTTCSRCHKATGNYTCRGTRSVTGLTQTAIHTHTCERSTGRMCSSLVLVLLISVPLM